MKVYNYLTRDEAVELAGEEMVDTVEAMNCEFDGDVADEVQFSSTYTDEDLTVTAYYYQDMDDVDNCDGDLGSLDWELDHYKVIVWN